MVFFSCENCSEALKKKQVERHLRKCPNASYSCIDCQGVFTARTYGQHMKCVSEQQKYGGKDYVEKEAKGELKQNAWCEQVSRAIELVTDDEVRRLLNSVVEYSNIPRKEAKFINFLTNSCKLRNKSLAQRAWAAIACEAEKMRAEAIKLNAAQKVSKEVEKPAAAMSQPQEVSNGAEVLLKTVESKKIDTPTFKWKSTIKRKLKEAGGEMKVKKLRREVLRTFTENLGEPGDEETFNEKLASAGVQVEGKIARLA